MTPGPWERVVIIHQILDDPMQGGIIDLKDGRHVVIPPDDRCEADFRAAQAWREMSSQTEAGRSTRIRVADGRLAVVGISHLRHHPLDMEILAAFGRDVEAGKRAVLDESRWTAPGIDYDPPCYPDGFHLALYGKFTGIMEIATGVLYEAGGLTIKDDLPETLVASAQGRQLREIIAIPQLAGLDLPILRIERRRNPFSGVPEIHIELIDEEGWVILE